MISLFFSGCVDPGLFKEGKERRGEKEKKKKKDLGNDFFILFLYFVNSGSGAAYGRWMGRGKKKRPGKEEMRFQRYP